MDLTFRIDEREILGYFREVGEQAPFGIAVALNRTAELATAAGRVHAREVFQVRSEQALRYALPVTLKAPFRATKQNLRAIIEPEKIGQIYGPFEQGAWHTADRLGRLPAIPTRALRPSPKALVAKQMFPHNLGLAPRLDPKGTKYYALGRNSIRKGLTPFKVKDGKQVMEGRFGTYQVPSKRDPNVMLIFQRRAGPGYKGGVLLWVLKPVVRRPPLLQLFQTVQRTLDTEWPKQILGAMEYAVNSAARHAGYSGA